MKRHESGCRALRRLRTRWVSERCTTCRPRRSFSRVPGYSEGTLFPWVVSDFGLVDAIEAGLVKIPRVPVEDDTLQEGGAPTYRNLWGRIRDDLPKKGGRRTPSRVRHNRLLPLQGALHSLYANYQKAFERWDEC